MEATFFICCILLVALLGSLCAWEAALEIPLRHNTILGASTAIENGVIIEDVGDVDYLLIVTSPEGEQESEPAVGGRKGEKDCCT